MQRVRLLCVGKMSTSFLAQGVAEYSKRLAPLCRFEVVEIGEEYVDEKSGSPALIQAALEKEGQKILEAVPKNARIYALCIEGRQYSSDELAKELNQAAVSGSGEVVFIIGSSHGLAEKVKKAAVVRMSMSKMTFPHQMARLMLAEQIYRAYKIQQGSRYHK